MATDTSRPADFDTYWQAVDDDLTKYPAAPTLEKLPPNSDEHSTTYAAKLTSSGPYRIFGYLSIPNGTGPFKLVGDEQNEKTLEANPDYWGGAPAIQTLVWEYIPDGQTRLNAFLGNQAQAIDRVPPEHLPMIEATEGMAFTSVTGFENVNLWTRMDAAEPWDPGAGRLRRRTRGAHR